jgi:hypothetical protein
MNRKDDLQHSRLYMPVIATPVVSLLFGRKKTEPQPVEVEIVAKPKSRKLAGFPVAKYDLAEDKVRFSNRVGLFKKRWVVAKEFPIYEITGVESLGNWLSFSWNNERYHFILKPKGSSFANLAQQIAVLQAEYQKNLQKTRQAELCRNELLAVITASLPIVDCSFDILMGLHEKRVSWMLLENYVQTLGGAFNFKSQTLPPLDLNFVKIAAAVGNQVAKETAQEAFGILRAMYGYFQDLVSQKDLADIVPNIGYVQGVVLAYFTLNDLWFAKVVGEADIQNEFNAFKGQLADLAEQTNFSADVGVFSSALMGTDTLGDSILGARLSFRERIKQL